MPMLLGERWKLRWLSEAGLQSADVHWSKGGMSLFSAISSRSLPLRSEAEGRCHPNTVLWL